MTAAYEDVRESWGETLPKGAVLQAVPAGLANARPAGHVPGQHWDDADDGPSAPRPQPNSDDEEAGLG